MSTTTLEQQQGTKEEATFAPLMQSTYFSENGEFRVLEDINRVENTSGANGRVWLVFTSDVSWPGPQERLIGGPREIPVRYGIRGIPLDSIKVQITEAFNKAIDLLHKTNCGDRFVGNINLYWPLTAPGLNPEPNYIFETNCHAVIAVGAFTGRVQYDHPTAS